MFKNMRGYEALTAIIFFSFLSLPTISFAQCSGVDPDMATHVSQQIDSRIGSSNPSSGLNFLNGLDSYVDGWSLDRAIWNNNSWTKNGIALNFTGVAIGHDDIASGRHDSIPFHGGVTMITPRHFVTAQHNMLLNGTIVTFLNSSGGRVTRNVVNSVNVASDINIGVLDSDVDSSIAYYPIMSIETEKSLLTKYGQTNLSIPIIVLNALRQGLVHAFSVNNLSHGLYVSTKVMPEDVLPPVSSETRTLFSKKIISGDSSQPGFLISENRPVLLFTNSTDSFGPYLGSYISQINSAIDTLGSNGYHVTEYSPSCFTKSKSELLPPANFIAATKTSCLANGSEAAVTLTWQAPPSSSVTPESYSLVIDNDAPISLSATTLSYMHSQARSSERHSYNIFTNYGSSKSVAATTNVQTSALCSNPYVPPVTTTLPTVTPTPTPGNGIPTPTPTSVPSMTPTPTSTPTPPLNNRPTVSAGVDQTIAWPNNKVTLAGVVHDDGRPAQVALIQRWTAIGTNAASVSFSNPTSLNAIVTFAEPGTYTLILSVSDSLLSASDQMVVNVSGDNIPPNISMSSPVTNQSFEEGTIDFSASASDNVGVTGVQFYLAGTALNTEDTSAPWSTSKNLAPGSYRIYAIARDAGGNKTTSNEVNFVVTKKVEVVVNSKPTVAAGSDQTIEWPENSVNLSGLASDDGKPSGSLSQKWSAIGSNASAVSFDSSISLHTIARFSASGSYTLNLSVSDGELSSSDNMIVLVNKDSTPPIRSNGSPNTTLLSSSKTTTVSLNTDESATCSWSSTPSTPFASMTGKFTTTGGTTHSFSINVTPGTSYSVYVKCRDQFQNSNTGDFPILFAVANLPVVEPVADKTVPVVTMSSPVTNQSFEEGTIDFSASASDNVGVTGVQFYLAGTALNTEDTSAPWSTSKNLAPGSYRIYAIARDAGGNKTTSNEVNFVVTKKVEVVVDEIHENLTISNNDSTPPVRLNGSPVTTISGTTKNTIVSLNTDESATCRFSSTQNVLYSNMTGRFTNTGGTSHSVTVNLTPGTSYLYYVKCIDQSNNANSSDYPILFATANLQSVPVPENQIYSPQASEQDTTPASVTARLVERSLINTTIQDNPKNNTNVILKSITRNLHLNDKGEDVRILQRVLNDLGYSVTSSGPGSFGNETTLFDSQTADALSRYQSDRSAAGVLSTGVLDNVSLIFINADIVKLTNETNAFEQKLATTEQEKVTEINSLSSFFDFLLEKLNTVNIGFNKFLKEKLNLF